MKHNNQRNSLVLITGRSRSGTSSLWNALRQLDVFFSIYEPFNPKITEYAISNRRLGARHKRITDYFSEYKALFNKDSSFIQLLSQSSGVNPYKAKQIALIIEEILFLSPKDKTLLLKSPKIDFSIPYIINRIKNTKHLYMVRNPRSVFTSMISLADKDINTLPKNYLLEEFDYNRLLLDEYFKNIYMPFIKRSTYSFFYLVWSLSVHIAHKTKNTLVVNLDDLQYDTYNTIETILTFLGIEYLDTDLTKIASKIEVTRQFIDLTKDLNKRLKEEEEFVNRKIKENNLLEDMYSYLKKTYWPK